MMRNLAIVSPWARSLGVALTLSCASAGVVTGQVDSVQVIPGAHYRAGALKRLVLGSNYRELWTTPLRLPLLQPDTFAGGLTLLQEGGGLQTRSLRFVGRDGAQYVFRSVDKEETELPDDLQETVVSDVIQDQISAKHPAGAPVAAALLEAAGVLHATPVMAVMAPSRVLGEFEDEFSGMLGIIEIRPEDPEDGGRFGDFPRVIGTERLLERLEESPRDRVDAPAYLRARLMDVFLNDWDRHFDQWRWAQEDRGDTRYWLPIPRDRDNAFFDSEGLIAIVGRAWRPFVISFEPDYSQLYGLVHNAQEFDRPVLAQLTRNEWETIASDVQSRLTDAVIADAVAQLPVEYRHSDGAELQAKLLARRDALPEMAHRFYGWIATEAEVEATDEAEWLLVDREASGVRVRLGLGEPGAEAYYDRTFLPTETREVRVYLRGGADRTVVQGAGGGEMLVRIIGGGGDDRLEDLATARGRTVFYDDRGENVVLPGPRTRVDRTSYRPVPFDTILFRNEPPSRDWGGSFSWLATDIDWESEIGPVVQVGPAWIRYGFRRQPFASRSGFHLEYAPYRNRVGVSAMARRIWTGNRGETRLDGRATQISLTRFHGFGNDTAEGDSERFRVWSNELSAKVEFERAFTPSLALWLGPAAALFDPDADVDSPARLLDAPGHQSFGVLGVRAGGDYDVRDDEHYPRRGARVLSSGGFYPLAWGDAPDAFARVHSVATGYLPLPLPLEATLALRLGGERVWGEAPIQYLAHLGGSSSLRGFRRERFTGDAALFGSTELRTRLGKANLRVVRGDFGTILFADAGRVFLDGEDSSDWHTGFGGGLWFGLLDRNYIVRLSYSEGERRRLSVGLGVPF